MSRPPKSFAHLPGCPRLMFWDAGDHEAECTCDHESQTAERKELFGLDGMASPIPRRNTLDALTSMLRRVYGSPVPMAKHADMEQVARDCLFVMMQPAGPCAHARAFFYESESGEWGCAACDMWDDAFAK